MKFTCYLLIIVALIIAGLAAFCGRPWDKRTYPDHLDNQDDKVIYELTRRVTLGKGTTDKQRQLPGN